MKAIQDAIQTPEATRRLQEALGGLISAHPSTHWRSDLSTSNRFPFQYYVTGMSEPGPDADEVLVISVECFDPHDGTGEHLVVSADITGEEGLLLAESPRTVIDVPPEAVVLHDPENVTAGITVQIQDATDGIAQWIDNQNVLVERALGQRPRSGLSRNA